MFETGRWFTPRVNRFGQITVRSNAYSVPVRFIGRQLRALLHVNDLVVPPGHGPRPRKPCSASPGPSRGRRRWNRPAQPAASPRSTTSGGPLPAPRTARPPAPVH
ncbi:Mu transposase domain-containing protein [Streptomyces chartreusis]